MASPGVPPTSTAAFTLPQRRGSVGSQQPVAHSDVRPTGNDLNRNGDQGNKHDNRPSNQETASTASKSEALRNFASASDLGLPLPDNLPSSSLTPRLAFNRTARTKVQPQGENPNQTDSDSGNAFHGPPSKILRAVSPDKPTINPGLITGEYVPEPVSRPRSQQHKGLGQSQEQSTPQRRGNKRQRIEAPSSNIARQATSPIDIATINRPITQRSALGGHNQQQRQQSNIHLPSPPHHLPPQPYPPHATPASRIPRAYTYPNSDHGLNFITLGQLTMLIRTKAVLLNRLLADTSTTPTSFRIAPSALSRALFPPLTVDTGLWPTPHEVAIYYHRLGITDDDADEDFPPPSSSASAALARSEDDASAAASSSGRAGLNGLAYLAAASAREFYARGTRFLPLLLLGFSSTTALGPAQREQQQQRRASVAALRAWVRGMRGPRWWEGADEAFPPWALAYAEHVFAGDAAPPACRVCRATRGAHAAGCRGDVCWECLRPAYEHEGGMCVTREGPVRWRVEVDEAGGVVMQGEFAGRYARGQQRREERQREREGVEGVEDESESAMDVGMWVN